MEDLGKRVEYITLGLMFNMIQGGSRACAGFVLRVNRLLEFVIYAAVCSYLMCQFMKLLCFLTACTSECMVPI